jgi:hypothetical protein
MTKRRTTGIIWSSIDEPVISTKKIASRLCKIGILKQRWVDCQKQRSSIGLRQARRQTSYDMLSSSFSISGTNPSKFVQPAAWLYGTTHILDPALLASMLLRANQVIE